MMDNKQQLTGLQRQSTVHKQKDSISQLPQKPLPQPPNPHSVPDMKTQLEHQKQLNKQKFEEPFFIKLGDGSNKEENMKIVKQKASEEKRRESTLSGEDNEEKKMAQNRRLSVRKRESRHQTVYEATEEEESSPGIKRKSTSKGAISPQKKTKGDGILSDDEKYEKVSEDTSVQGAPGTVKTLPQLVQVDVNLDTLKNFLEDIQEAINDHAKSISVMQSDLKRKAYEKTIGHYLQKISEALHKECGERPHAFRLDHEQNNWLQENFQTEDSTQLKRQAEKMMDKVEVIGLNIINFHKHRNDTNERLDKLEKLIPKCFTIDQFREESQLMETRILKYTNERLGTFQENLNAQKHELTEAMTQFNKRVGDNQAETVWRIKDCEELLRSRVSDKYVNDGIKALEDKVTKQLNYNDEKGVERLEKAFKELGQRVIQTNQFFNEKVEDQRKVMMTYDSKINSMATIDRLLSIQTGQKDMKYNLERELEMIQEHVKEVKDKISELSKRFSNLELAAMNDTLGQYMPTTTAAHVPHSTHGHSQQMNTSGPQASTNSAQQTSRNQGQFSGTQADKKSQSSAGHAKHKSPESTKNAHAPQQQHSPVSPMLRKRGTRMEQAMFQEVEKKVLAFEDQIYNLETKIDSLKKQVDSKPSQNDILAMTSNHLSKEDLVHLLPSEELMQERMKYLVKDEVEQLNQKMIEQLKGVDIKLTRLRAELDIHSIHRQLERKANEDQVRGDFENHEFKIGTLDRNIIRMATDFETFQLALNKLHSAIVELQESNRDVLLGKRTNNCLSCGKGGDGANQVMGKDGRMYKGMENKNAGGQSSGPDDITMPTQNYMMYAGESTGFFNHSVAPVQNHQSAMDLSSHQPTQSAQDFYSKMKPSHSFYDNHYDTATNNLPSVHRKKNSFNPQNAGVLKNIASHAGIAGNSNPNYNSSSNSMINHSFTLGTQSATGLAQKSKKLPFGFQVQKEKRDLFKIQEKQRGKSNYGNRPQSNRIMDDSNMQGNRPESVQNRDINGGSSGDRRFNFNNTFDT